MPSITQKVSPCLWFAQDAEAAARFYTAIFPDSRVERVTAMPADSHSGPGGSVPIVEFTLCGQPFLAFSAAQMEPFNHAISLMVSCADQAEIDRVWNALLDGGTAEQCGWLKDRFGVSWQIVPAEMADMIADADRVRARRVAEAMLGMVKLDLAALRAAYESAGSGGGRAATPGRR